MKIFKFLVNLPRTIQYSFLLVNKKYSELRDILMKKLARMPNDLPGNYFALQLFGSTKEFETSRDYLYRILKINTYVSQKILKFYSDVVIAGLLAKEKFTLVIEDCDCLLPRVSEAGLYLQYTKQLCNALYKSWNFARTEEISKTMINQGLDSSFFETYMKAIAIERGKTAK